MTGALNHFAFQLGGALALLLLASPVGTAQARLVPSRGVGWDILQVLRPGDRVEVETRDNRRHSGTFLAYSEDAISLLQGKREVGYRREEIVQVVLVEPARRGHAALKGLLVGGGIGGGVGAFLSALLSEEGYTGADFARDVAVSAFALGAIGAAVGAAVARRLRTPIYRAPPAGAPGPSSPALAPYPSTTGPGSLPAALGEVYRVFGTDQAAREVAWELACEVSVPRITVEPGKADSSLRPAVGGAPFRMTKKGRASSCRGD